MPNDENRRLSYRPEINAGNILTALSMLGSIIVTAAVFYARAQVQDIRITNLENLSSKMVITMDKIAENQSETRALIVEIRRERNGK